MRGKSINCVDKADSLIESGGEDNLRYACLQLRMAIEHLFYELIPLYSDELPTDILNKWQPKQIIDALLDCDPHVDEDATLTFFDYNEDGSRGKPFSQRSQKGVSKRLLKKYYHKLGSYLHSPMTDDDLDLSKFESFLRNTVAMLRDYSADTVISNIRKFAFVECVCGRTIKRNVAALQVTPRVTCPDVKCDAMFDYSNNEDGTCTFTPVNHSFTCTNCDTVNYFGAHLVSDGLEITCDECESKIRVRVVYSIEPVNDTVKNS